MPPPVLGSVCTIHSRYRGRIHQVVIFPNQLAIVDDLPRTLYTGNLEFLRRPLLGSSVNKGIEMGRGPMMQVPRPDWLVEFL
jgi:hypothetical protein